MHRTHTGTAAANRPGGVKDHGGAGDRAAAPARSGVARLSRPVVLIGLMGAGKTAIGRPLAARLGLPFADSDDEIERLAGCSIAGIFARFGEQAFRDRERRVLARMLAAGAGVLATGGGACMDPATRRLIRDSARSVWLRASLDTLVQRTGPRTGPPPGHRHDRPLLAGGDRRSILARLMQDRYPVYAAADIVIDTDGDTIGESVERIVRALGVEPDVSAPPCA